MTILNFKKPSLTEIKLTISDDPLYLKPLPMKLLSFADKISDKDVPKAEQNIAFAMIIKTVLCDKDGNKFSNIDDMSADDLTEIFSLEDFTSIFEVIMPAQKDIEPGK